MLLFFILNKRCIWKKLPGAAYVKNYYDGYSFVGTVGFTNERFTSSDTHGRGKLTESVVTVPGLTTKLYKAFYYDEKGRMVKRVESNLMAGFNVVNTTYSFTDKPLVVTRTHNGGAGFSMSETYTYSYDHADRLIKTEHTLNGSTITMAEYTYDNLGRMSSKRFHGKEAFRTDYTYNIRNWLTGMSGDLFTQNLHYTDGVGTACYNGNISSMIWQSGNETTVRGYKYTYDGLNRMKNGTYGEGNTLSTNAGRYSEIANNYDKNGNIGAGFLRNGRISDGSYSTISALVPTYNGNQLQSMYDACPYTPYEGTFGYDAGYGDGIEYFYDGNGNLTQDLNKGISNISYNMLSLPSVVTFSNGSTITYYYDAEGNKVRVIYSITGKTSLQRNYSNGVIYDNGSQQCLITEEGYIALQENNKYYYYLKDHQGNNRVVVDEDENIVEVNHYYPFGGVFEPTGDVQRYKYNGKEYIADGGMNWYDYGARHYDPAIGRFTTMDPLAEKYYSTSPYVYCDNNPILYIDPTGEMKVIYNPDGTYKETTHNNWFHNTFMGRQEYIDYGNRMTRLSEEDFWQWQTTGQWGSFKPADGLTSFEFWLDSASDNVIDGAVKFFISEAYSTPNSIAAMFTGRTLGGSLLTPMEKQEKFVDLVNALPVTKFLKVVHPGTAKNFYKAHSSGYFTKQKYQNKVNRYKSFIKRGNAYNKIIDYFVSPLNEINDNKDELDY